MGADSTKDNARPRSSDNEVTAHRMTEVLVGHHTGHECFAISATLVRCLQNEMVSVSGGVLMLHAPPSYLFSESFVDVGVSPVTRNPPWEFGWTATQEQIKRWFDFFLESWHETGTHNGCPSRASVFGTGK